MVLLSIVVAIAAAYGGLRAFLARHDGIQLIASSVAFGVAVSGMHYTAMHGMRFVPLGGRRITMGGGLAASQQILAMVVAVLCFVIAAGFLLSLVPDPRRQSVAPLRLMPRRRITVAAEADAAPIALTAPRLMPAPLGGLGQPPRAAPAPRLPVEGANGTHFIDAADVRSVRADAHYTRCMTAPANGCAPGRFRKPKPSSTPACSCGSTAATSWRSPMSLSSARKATAP